MLGKTFITNTELSFKGFIIPQGTKFEIIETDISWGEDENAVKVLFYYQEHEECIQIMSLKNIYEIADK